MIDSRERYTPEGSAMSQPVERFSFSVEHEIAYEDVNGDWVKFAAYEALKAKVECLEGKIELDQAKLRGEEETVKRVVAHSEAQAKRIAELEATLEDIADGKPRLMHDQSGYEFFCYQYNPTEKARKALFASKFSSASKNGDSNEI